MIFRKYSAHRIILLSLVMVTGFFLPTASGKEGHIKVGVLANRGYEQCRTRWEPTIHYLTTKVPPHKFELIPLSFEQIIPAARDGKVDFVICNSGIFVDIEAMYGATGIATIKTRIMDEYYTVFGGVIFTRSDNQSIKTFRDLKGKSFIAADRDSLGGWQVQWREFKRAGIDPHKYFSSLRFAGQHDAVVFEVLSGAADAGACRTDVLEHLAADRKINLADIRLIAEGRDVNTARKSFPFLLSTHLYPEWAFAKLSHTPSDLASRVSLALQGMKADDHAAVAGECGGWSYPLNYQPVHDLQQELMIGYYGKFTTMSLQETVSKYWREIVILVLVFTILTMALFWVAVLYRRSSRLRIRLDNELKERDKIAEALRESEERWNFALEGSGDGVWDWNAVTNEVFFSQQWKTMLGYEEHEIGNTLAEWDKRVHPDDRDHVYREINRHFAGETPIYISEHRIQCKDGSYKWILDRGKVVSRTEENKPLRVVGTHTDLTGRKNAEEELKASKSKLDLALASAGMGTWILNLADGKRHFDDQIYHLLGINPDTFQGTPEEFFHVIHPEDHEKVKEALDRTINLGLPYEPEYRVILPDGTIRFIAARGMMTLDDTGKPMRIDGVGWDITERKQIEEALLESESKFRDLSEKAMVGVYLIQDNLFKYVNAEFARIFGYSIDEMTDKLGPADVIFPDDLPLVEESLRKRISGQLKSISYSFRILTKERDIRHMEVYSSRTTYQGRLAVIGSALDISDRKWMEEAIRKSEERYRSIFENAREGIFQSTPEGRFIQVNPAMARMCGYASPEEMMETITDMATQHYVDPEERDVFKASIEELGSVENFRIETYRKNRSRIWVSINARVVRDETGRILYYEGTHEDVTEQKLMEDMIKENERRYRHLVENSNDIIYTTDTKGILTYVNPATERLTGYPISQLFGKHYSMLTRKDYREPMNGHYEKQYREKNQITYYEFPIVTKDGLEIWIGQQAQLIFDQERIIGFQATARDITDRMKVEEEQRERERLTALIQTAGMISHEMNQPLQAILGQADLIRLSLPSGDAKNERLEIIKDQIERMRAITRKLVNISRYKTKPYAGKSTIVDLEKSAE
jgi:PAS domain S-box-containing protein